MTLPKDPSKPVNTATESSVEVALGTLAGALIVSTAQHYGVTPDDLTWLVGTATGVAGGVSALVHAIRSWRKR